MSAAQWRRAMNSGATAVSAQGSLWAQRPVAGGASIPAVRPRPALGDFAAAISARHVIAMLALVLYPWAASPFFAFQIGGQSLTLGIIALSLAFLAGYGGMVSLAQMTVAGVAAYTVGILGTSAATQISLGWPWWLVVPMAVVAATVVATFIGWLSVRTEGIYTIMITLAIGVAFHYLALQNYSVFNGHAGLHKVVPPTLLGIYWRDPIPYYYLALFWALLAYLFVKYIVRTPFGIALQGVRDNPRRMNALGFNVVAIRVAAYAVAGFIAAIGGVLLVWYNGLVAPGTVAVGSLLNVLIIAVLGGLRHPIGAFAGAVVFVLLQNFAIDLLGTDYRERFNLVIGGLFLLIVLFSPDGILGWWAALRRRLLPRAANAGPPRQLPH